MLDQLTVRLRAGRAGRAIRYSLVSVVAIVTSSVLLLVMHGLLFWSATWSNIIATALATLPSYKLNRKWVWDKKGNSDLWREVAPFWSLAFAGLVLSTLAVKTVSAAGHTYHWRHRTDTVVVAATSVLAFGLLWAVRFMVLNRLFASRPVEVGVALQTGDGGDRLLDDRHDALRDV